jgi:Fic family protein
VIEMREFSFENRTKELLVPAIVNLLTQIHEYRGKQALFIEARPDVLNNLVQLAKIQSTDASNKIEGIYTADERLELLVRDKTRPTNRNEQEIAGYRDVLALIHENHDYIPPKPGMILQLHRDLYKFSRLEGGHYRISDNAITGELPSGERVIRFQPVSAWETPGCMEGLCEAWVKALSDETLDPLLLMPSFILDFLCIHPFSDGNGRMSRLLTLLLLYRSGYIVGKYISIEKLIERTRQSYYDALQASSIGWHENANDYAPFTQYLLGVILAAYRDFSDRIDVLSVQNPGKSGRIRAIIKETLGRITKAEIMKRCPDISQVTVQRTLNELQKTGEIIKISGGRYTAYTWNRDKE